MEEINFKQLLSYFMEKIIYIAIAAVLGVILGFVYTSYIQVPMYKSSTSLLLTSDGENITQSDVQLNKQLVSTYRELITSRKILSQVINELNLKTSVENLAQNISVVAVNDTEIIKISVVDVDSNAAADIANSIAKVFSEELVYMKLKNVNVIDKGIVPKSPYNTNVVMQTAIGGIVGFILASGIIFVMFYFDSTIQSVEQVESNTSLPVLASVTLKKSKNRDDKKYRLAVANNPKSVISEEIKALRTNLLFSEIDREIQTIMVTSSMPNEGKSFVSSNLACAYAQMGKNVLIVDCDMRRGTQNTIFDVSNNIGLSNLLIDKNADYTKYIKRTRVSKVSLLPSGVVPPNPVELLSSAKNKELIQKLRKAYDIIIFDCPPVLGLTDAVVITPMIDKTILVSSRKKTPIDSLQASKKILEQNNVQIAGVVINHMDPKKKNNYYGYYRYYEK